MTNECVCVVVGFLATHKLQLIKMKMQAIVEESVNVHKSAKNNADSLRFCDSSTTAHY